MSKDYLAKDVPTLVGRISFDGKPMKETDAYLVAEFLALNTYLLIDLFGDELSALRYRRALLSNKIIDAKVVFEGYKALKDALLSEEFLEEGNWLVFKQQAVMINPIWIVTPLTNHYSSGELTVDALSKCLQWAMFGNHLTIDTGSAQEAAQEYLDDEFKMAHEPIDTGLMYAIHKLVEKDFCGVIPEMEEFQGSHSGGATTELSRRKASAHRKFSYMRISEQEVAYWKYRFSGIDLPTSNEVGIPLLKTEGEGLERTIVPFPQVDETPIEIQLVPKDALRKRVISPEGTLRMYLQNDVAKLIEPVMNKHHWCNLHDQSISQRLCLAASRDGSYVTVDSSKASDFVRLSHNRLIYSNTTIERAMLETRARYCKVPDPDVPEPDFWDKLIIPLEKFAPMGSRLCFDSEENFFGYLAEIAVNVEAGRRSQKGDFVVFGDDVIIRSEFWPRYRLLLALARIRVNDSKTYDSTHGKIIFREACGMYAANGVNITPCRISRKYRGIFNILRDSKDDGAVGMVMPPAAETLGLLDLLNRLTVSGLHNVRRALYSMLSNEKWMRSIWRVTLSDYRRDEERIAHGEKPLQSYRTPTLITYDHVDANFSVPERIGKYRGNPTWITRSRCLVVIARPKRAPMDSIDAFIWSSTRPVDEYEGRSALLLQNVKRLTYCGTGDCVWRWENHSTSKRNASRKRRPRQ